MITKMSTFITIMNDGMVTESCNKQIRTNTRPSVMRHLFIVTIKSLIRTTLNGNKGAQIIDGRRSLIRLKVRLCSDRLHCTSSLPESNQVIISLCCAEGAAVTVSTGNPKPSRHTERARAAGGCTSAAEGFLSVLQVNEGKAVTVAADGMKTEPDSKARGEKIRFCCHL